MEKLRMHSLNKVDENIERIGQLFFFVTVGRIC